MYIGHLDVEAEIASLICVTERALRVETMKVLEEDPSDLRQGDVVLSFGTPSWWT